MHGNTEREAEHDEDGELDFGSSDQRPDAIRHEFLQDEGDDPPLL
jgi:hypothetical protein